MTTHSNDTSYGRKHLTELHLVYKIKRGRLVPYQLYLTREEAEENLALVNRDGTWKIADIDCGGWGIVDATREGDGIVIAGVVGRNKPIDTSEEAIEREGREGRCIACGVSNAHAPTCPLHPALYLS